MLENKPLDNRSKILNAAQHMLQTRGFNAFSYRDLAAEVNIKSSSVHYHFPTKEDLAVALLEKYSNAIQIRLATLNRGGTDPLVRIRNFLTWFEDIGSVDGRVCIAGMLASDFATLSTALQARVAETYEMIESWFTVQIELALEGQNDTKAPQMAMFVMSAVQGALFGARVFNQPNRIKDVVSMIDHCLLHTVQPVEDAVV